MTKECGVRSKTLANAICHNLVTPDIEKYDYIMPSNAEMRNATANGGQL